MKSRRPELTKKQQQEAMLLRVAAGDSRYRLLVVQAIVTAGGEELMESFGFTSEQAVAWASATITRARGYLNAPEEAEQVG